MSKQLQPTRACATRLLKFGWALAVAGLFALTAPQSAHAQSVAVAKNFCAGAPGDYTDPANCPLATSVTANTPVFYVISATNLPGGTSSVNLTDAYPPGFVPNTNAVTCFVTTPGNPLPVSQPFNGTWSPSLDIDIPLAIGATVTCYVEGKFDPSGGYTLKSNTVSVPGGLASSVNTFVTQGSMGADLEVTKLVDPLSLNVSDGLEHTVRYTINIKNNGPAAVDVGKYLVLHDSLSLPQDGVPFRVTLASGSFSCSVTAGPNDCLTQTPANVVSYAPQIIGTMAPHHMFDWGFPTNQGRLQPGAVITLKFRVKVQKILGIPCYRQLNSDGLKNKAFFTLVAPDGTAVTDDNPLNNSASVTLPIDTGNTVYDPNCGKSQLTITKKLLGSANPRPWNSTVDYEIKIKNIANPSQTITLHNRELTDFIVEGLGTPPFTRTFAGVTCTSTPSWICGVFSSTGGGIGLPPFKFTYYGQQKESWWGAPGAELKLPPGGIVTFKISFIYSDPDCDTVPDVDPKPIDNVAQISYMATAVGADPGSAQNEPYIQTATATTKMETPRRCKFVVTKSPPLPVGQTLHFGDELTYHATFTNRDAPRHIGTVMDAVRITDAAYATQVPFTATWTCSSAASGPNAVTGFASNGSAQGHAIHTGSPAQGTVVMSQPPTIFFPTNSTLLCTIKIKVKRPAFNNPHCSMNPAYFENMALMDVTRPYNSNVHWPPSSPYVPALPLNPALQNANWATVQTLLPKCFDVVINKRASVDGITPAWTWAPGGPKVNYTIRLTNTGTSGTLSGSGSTWATWNGLGVTDTVLPPYFGNQVEAGNTFSGPFVPCPTPPGWCAVPSPPPTSAGQSHAGVASLAPSQTGVWLLTLDGPFQDGPPIHNCVTVAKKGTFNTPDYYNSSNHLPETCVDVPVLKTRPLTVIKTVVNATGSTLPFFVPAMTFNVKATCGPYPLANPNLSLTTSAGNIPPSISVSGTYPNVPVGATCTIAEFGPMPAIPAGAQAACNKFAYWETTISPPSINIASSGTNTVTVTNTLKCKPGSLAVTKTIVGGNYLPSTTTTVHVNCPGVGQYDLPFTPSGTQTASTSIPNGTLCTITEDSNPSSWTVSGASCNPWSWSPPIITPSNPFPVSGQTIVTVQNRSMCNPTSGSLTVNKVVTGPGPVPQNTFNIMVTCNSTQYPLPPLGNNGSYTIPGIPLNAVCTVSETPQSPSTFSNAYSAATCPGSAPFEWITPPDSSIPISGGSQTVTVTNTYKCKGQKSGSPQGGGAGTTAGQQGSDTLLGCKPPMVMDSKRKICTCPERTEFKNGQCVKKSSFLEDVLGHVSIGVGVGVGGGGRGGQGGGQGDGKGEGTGPH